MRGLAALLCAFTHIYTLESVFFFTYQRLFIRAAKDCIVQLLDKDERARLGSRSGASEVKQHKWFAKVNWGLLRNARPPVSQANTLAQSIYAIAGPPECPASWSRHRRGNID